MVRRLLYLNGIAASLVAFHHGTAYGFAAMFQWGGNAGNLEPLGSLSYFITLAIRQWDSFGIPAFLFVSAFFVVFSARGPQAELKLAMMAGRLKQFFWPYVIWTTIVLLLLQKWPRSLEDVLGKYYFIPVLMQFFLLSPWLVKWAKRNPRAVLLGTGLIQFFVMALRYLRDINVFFVGQRLLVKITPQWLFPGLIFYFALGLVVALHMPAAKAWLAKHRRNLVVVVLVTGILSLVEYQLAGIWSGTGWVGPDFVGVFRTIYAVTFILMYLAFEDVKLPLSKQIQEVGAVSLGVYLLNTPVIYVVSSLLFHFVPGVLKIQALYQPILIVTGLFIPLLIITFVKRSPLKVAYRFMFG